MIRKVLIVFMYVLFSQVLMADDVKFTAEAPKVVEAGGRFRLIYTVNQQVDNFIPPALDNFTVLAGPSTSSSSNVSIVNGEVTKTFTLRYTYILQADREGEMQIPSARVKVDGKEYESNALTIEVIKGAPGQSGQQGTSGTTGNTSSSGTPSDKLFVKVLIDDARVYEQEPVVATIKLFSQVSITGLNNYEFPDFNGFYSQEIETPPLTSLTREEYNGEVYGTGVIQKFLLYPQKSGELTISPFKIECLYQKPSRNQPRSIFDDFFGNYETYRQNLVSDEVKIQVDPLPAGAPAEFTGAVGQFKASASIDKAQLKTNEAITYKIVVSGRGNLKMINAPELDLPSNFEVYDPKITENIKNQEGGSLGRKTFEYYLIPRHPGTYTIPSLNFVFFNPSTRRYHTVRTNNYDIKVIKGEDDSTMAMSSVYNKENLRFIGRDIRFIKTGPARLKEKGAFFFGSWLFVAIYTGGLIIFFLTLFVRHQNKKQRANVQLMKNKKANRIARQRLKQSRRLMKENENVAFYDELTRSMWLYLSEKLGIPIAELTKDRAREEMLENEVNEKTIEEFLQILDDCEFARYAPSKERKSMDELYQEAVDVLSKLQGNLKNRKLKI